MKSQQRMPGRRDQRRQAREQLYWLHHAVGLAATLSAARPRVGLISVQLDQFDGYVNASPSLVTPPRLLVLSASATWFD